MTDQPTITDKTIDAAREAVQAAIPTGLSHGAAEHIGLGVAYAVAPHIAAQALRVVSEQISHRANELRDSFRSGAVSIDYINGMEDADVWIERAIAAYEPTAEEAR